MRAKLFLMLLPLLLGLLVDQALQFTVLADGRFLDRRVAPYDPPLFNAAQRASLDRLRRAARGRPADASSNAVFDADLGWAPEPGSSRGGCSYDRFGARMGFEPLADRPPAGGRRLVVLGGSFTHCDEVADQEAWPALLDQELESIEVANLGFGAYGIDQALLRFRRDGATLEPDEVWLGLMPQALPRVLTVYRPALRHHELSVSFKPRFVLSGRDELVLVPNPARSVADCVRLLTDQSVFFEALAPVDHWVARFPSAYRPLGTHWSHYLATARLFLTRIEGRGRDPGPWLADRDGELFRLSRAIVRTLSAECRAGGARFRVVLLPDGKSLAFRRKTGGAYWQELLDQLARDGLEIVDLTGMFLEQDLDREAGAFRPGGHYSARTNRLVAARLARLLS